MTELLTVWLPVWLPPWFTAYLTDRLNCCCSLAWWCAIWLIHSLWFTNWPILTDLLADSLTDSLTDPLSHSLTHSLTLNPPQGIANVKKGGVVLARRKWRPDSQWGRGNMKKIWVPAEIIKVRPSAEGRETYDVSTVRSYRCCVNYN